MKLRVVVVLAALVLLVVVVGWFLAGNDGIPDAPVADKSEPVTVPAVSAPLPVAPAASNAPGSPPAVAVTPAPAPAAPGPMVQPFQKQPEASRPAVPPAMPAPASARQTAPAASDPPATVSPDAAAAAALDMDKASLMLRDFRTLMGTNPVGTNAEIMKAIMGGNSKRAMLGPPEGQSLNGNGELVDRWGTPYFFHQMSATHMEIHSAGPDKVFGTVDDVVQK